MKQGVLLLMLVLLIDVQFQKLIKVEMRCMEICF